MLSIIEDTLQNIIADLVYNRPIKAIYITRMVGDGVWRVRDGDATYLMIDIVTWLRFRYEVFANESLQSEHLGKLYGIPVLEDDEQVRQILKSVIYSIAGKQSV